MKDTFKGNELLFCPWCLTKGQRVIMVYKGPFYLCPKCYKEFWQSVDISPKKLFQMEKNRPHKKGGGNKSGRKRKKPKKYYKKEVLE